MSCCTYCSRQHPSQAKLLQPSDCPGARYCNFACRQADWFLRHKQVSSQRMTPKQQQQQQQQQQKIKSLKGTGYGGGVGDEKQRAAGRKRAAQRETQAWAAWQKELGTFCSSLRDKKQPAPLLLSREEPPPPSPPPPAAILDTLKQVLRCQAPDWWWQQPQRRLYETALEACRLLTEHHPKAWGDPDDDESAISALEELAQTSQLLTKQLEKESNGKEEKEEETASAGKGGAVASLAKATTGRVSSSATSAPPSSNNDKDSSLPLKVMEIRKEAMQAVSQVWERPECSMMGMGDYYRQNLRPLAFETVESFERPPHYYASNAGYRYGHASYGHVPVHYNNSKKKPPAPSKKSKKNDISIAPSAHSLWKELSTYPTALPIEYGSSIFVRAQEGRMDLLRVLMIGPDDTPYGNGAFLFDISLGQDYPHRPPQVQFLTTSSFLAVGEPKVRFNPNLYADGKVCLSLLGTWSGPGWQPGESTLLQVLISIQSLILGTSDPYFNEPGYESSQGTANGKAASAKYNRNIRNYTLRTAILPFLKNELNQKQQTSNDPPGTNEQSKAYFSEFDSVIHQHFRLKQRVIQKQLFQWLQDDPSLEPLYTEYWTVWDQLQQSSGKNAAKAAARSARRKREAPGVTHHADGVIEIDDDDGGANQAVFNNDADTEQAMKMSEGVKETELSNKRDTRQKVSELSKDRKKDEKESELSNNKPAIAKRNKPDPKGVTQHADGIIEIDDDDYNAQMALAIHASVTEQNQSSRPDRKKKHKKRSEAEQNDEEEDSKPAAVTNMGFERRTRRRMQTDAPGGGGTLVAAVASASGDVVDLT